MTDQQPTDPKPEQAQVDLSALQGFTFGAAWSPATPPSTRGDDRGDRSPRDRGDRRGPPRGPGGGGAPDRRGFRRPPSGTPGGDSRGPSGPGAGGPPSGERRPMGDRPFGDRPRGEGRPPRRDGGGFGHRPAEPFRPIVSVEFFPEDEVFKTLTKAIRLSGRTYELFSLARLVLDKPERHVLLIKPVGGEDAKLHVAVPDGLPFETEDEAVAHVLANHLETFCSTEVVEGEPPKGSFVCVMKCGVTGELLAPPNYHRYQAILQDHHARRLGSMPFEAFQRRLETVREPESVQQWLESMRKTTRFTLKSPPAAEAKVFDSLESLKFYLVTHHRDLLVKAVPQVRISGRLIPGLPGGRLRDSLDFLLDDQRRFPLDTANHLRARLRKVQFSLYKRGPKGVSYVSAVRRQFRLPGQTFSASIQRLLEFLETRPNFAASELPIEMLGLNADAVAAALAPKPAAVAPAPEAAKDAPAAEGETAPAAEAPAPVVAAELPAAPSGPTLTAEEHAALLQLRNDLRWLVTQGFVVEYENGELFCPPPRTQAEAARAAREEAAEEASESPADHAEAPPTEGSEG